jgi:DnaJ-class molecular chaperone
MNKYQQITEARNLLELPERASLEEIKANFRNLIRQWHPDISEETKEKCTEMTAKIIAAYAMVIDYCNHYRFSFSQEEVRLHFSAEEWWFERFGNDSIWT